MPLLPSPRSLRSTVAILLFCLACNTAFKDAMRRGDDLAATGQWDAAALAYEEATSLDPDDADARLALAMARREQSKLRVARGYALLQAGDAMGALAPFSEATRLDPKNGRAHEGLATAKQAVVAQAGVALAEGRYKASYQLSRAVLLVDPEHAEARQVEATAKEKIAEAAFTRGDAAEKAGARALALIDYGEALQFKPAHAEAATRSLALRKQLREEVTFYVALKNFDGDKTADELGSDVNAAAIGGGLDPTLPLRVVDKMPKPKAHTAQGMRLGGVFRGYNFGKKTTRSSQSCDYICGKELVPNPAYAAAEADMRTSQTALATAEGRLAAAKANILPAERARDTAKTSLDQKRTDADRAEQDYQKCKSAAGSQPNACSSEEQRKVRAEQDEKLAEEEAKRTETALSNAKSELSSAESDLFSKKSDASFKKTHFEQTPAKIEVDKHCLHTYAVDTVVVTGEIECLLSGEGLYDTVSVLNRSVTGRVTRTDQTFPAQAGVCAEVKNGDPLVIPGEGEVKKLVVSAAVGKAQQEILSTFTKYQEGYMTSARAHAVDGKVDDSTDAYVRFLFTLPGDDGGPLSSEAVSKVSAQRSVDETAVRIAVFGAR
ncbi:MAG: tetratricopeptide repeat protein [Polyangiaceae bacterium]|jgi:tetratricopeptide (TPR) repeat protein|nr:tetratricopeptide repeat protein [Polyangiaceae bacterium]